MQNTRKITKAMEMVAASKMRKAQERMRAARPYAEKIRNVAAHLSHANPEYRHPYLVTRDTVKKVGFIVVTTDKGLCGGLNTNVLRMALSKMREWEAQGESFEVCCIGNKGLGFMQRLGANVVSHVVGLGDKPHLESLIGAGEGHARRLRRGPLRRGGHFLHQLHQHDEAGAGDGAAAAADGRAARRSREGSLGLHLRARRASP